MNTEKHMRLHTKEYYQKVQTLLEVRKSKEDVLEALKTIGKKLSEGTF